MYFRCATCHGSIWAEGSKSDPSVRPRCEHCNRDYDLSEALGGRAGRKLGTRARELAKREQLDLPGAYSALLGLIPLDVVREFGSSGSTACRTSVTAPGAAEACEFDAEFKPAVDAGLLTSRQAFERGSRAAFAKRLSNRHGLSHTEALDVADNRSSLLQTIRARETAQRGSREPSGSPEFATGRSGSSKLVAVAAAVSLTLIAVGFVTSSRDPDADGTPALLADEMSADPREPGTTDRLPATTPAIGDALAASAELETDPRTGAILRISAAKPSTVLGALCESSIFLEPIDVRQAVPTLDSRRIGVIRDTRDLTRPAIVDIVRDRDSGRWTAGDGSAPLAARPAPDQLLQHVLN